MSVRELLQFERSVGMGQMVRQVVAQIGLCRVVRPRAPDVFHRYVALIAGLARDRMREVQVELFMPCCFKRRLATTTLWTSSGPS